MSNLSKSKYKNVRSKALGKMFASKKEARRYLQLFALEKSGQIFKLQTQVRFPLKIDNVLICTYIADFVYYNNLGTRIVEDTKGFKTDVYKLKYKLMLAVYGIRIKET